MGRLAKKIKKGFKKIGDFAEDIADTVGDAAEWVIDDVVGTVATEAARAVAGDKAANKVDKFIDDRIAPAVERGIKGVANTLNPLAHISNIAERGIIDGFVHTVVEGAQDVIGAGTRIAGGAKAEEKFDQFFDAKVQHWVEMVGGAAGAAALMFVPGGQAVLLADGLSILGATGLRAASGEKVSKLEWGFAGLGAAMSILPAAAVAGKAGSKVAAKSTSEIVKKTADVAENMSAVAKKTVATSKKSVVTKSSETAAKEVKNVDDVLDNMTTMQRLGANKGEILKDTATESAFGFGLVKIIEMVQKNKFDKETERLATQARMNMPENMRVLAGQENANFRPNFAAGAA